MTTAQKYRKKPVTIEAIQLTDDLRDHIAIQQWVESHGGHVKIPGFGSHIIIVTLEGDMRADLGDYIIKGVKGEFYPCKPDIFAETYEAV